MTDILLFGRTGQLGRRLEQLLSARYALAAPSSSDVNFRDIERVRSAIRRVGPGLVINAAAYTAVDDAESDGEAAFAVNALAPGEIAQEVEAIGAGLMHFSTDYVFDGDSRSPYHEDDETGPLNVYGESKLAGERRIQAGCASAIIFRTGWLYGPSGNNFLLRMKRLLNERTEVQVVDDQTGTPTSVLELADCVLEGLPEDPARLAAHCHERRGLYHLSCTGHGTWFDFAGEIRRRLEAEGRRVADLRAVASSVFPSPARRPAYSVLNKSRYVAVFGREPVHWRAALDRVW